MMKRQRFEWPGTRLKGDMGVSHPPDLENLPFRRAKVVLQCTFAGQISRLRIIGELLLLKVINGQQTKNFRRATSDTLKNLLKIQPCV